MIEQARESALSFMRFDMPLRTLFDFLFASPVILVSAVLSIASASILVISISSNIDDDSVTSSSIVNPGSRAEHAEPRFSRSGSITDSVHDGSDSSAFKSANQSSGPVSGNTGARSSREYKYRSKQGTINTGQQYYPSGLYEGQSDAAGDFSSTDNNSNRQSLFNYSDTSSASISGTANADSDSVTSENDAVLNDTPAVAPDGGNTEINFPPSMEEEVITDLGVTQTISCRPVVANGPPCMCTITTTDTNTNRIVSEVDDNCS